MAKPPDPGPISKRTAVLIYFGLAALFVVPLRLVGGMLFGSTQRGFGSTLIERSIATSSAA